MDTPKLKAQWQTALYMNMFLGFDFRRSCFGVSFQFIKTDLDQLPALMPQESGLGLRLGFGLVDYAWPFEGAFLVGCWPIRV